MTGTEVEIILQTDLYREEERVCSTFFLVPLVLNYIYICGTLTVFKN